MQNPTILPISDPIIKYSGNPRDSLERIFKHYINCSRNEVLINERICFENIEVKKSNLVTSQIDIERAMELMIIEPSNKNILELYSIIKEKYNDQEIDIKTLEKRRFNELVSQNIPPLKLCQLLLENIDNFNFEEDYEIIKKLNLNKYKSENAMQIFEKTYAKFLSSITDKEKILLENRFKYDEIIEDFNKDYDSKNLKKFLKLKITDNYILDDLEKSKDPNINKILEKYTLQKISSNNRLSWDGGFSSFSSSPANSAPPTPNARPRIGEIVVEKLNLSNENDKSSTKNTSCTIS